MSGFDDTDKKILRTLLSDARLSYREIARRNKLAVSTVIDRVAKLRHRGVFEGYSINLNHQKLGYNITAVIELSMRKEALSKEVEEDLLKTTNTFGVYYTTGNTDCFVIAKFKDTEELNSFLRSLNQKDYIKKTDTHITLKVLKEDFRGNV